MPGRKKVKELMSPISEYPVVHDTDTLKHAISVLKEHLNRGKGYRSLMVFSSTKKVGNEPELVGILTIRDILNAIKKKTMAYSNEELFSMSWQKFYEPKPLRSSVEIRVGSVIRPLVPAFLQVDDDVSVATRLMMTKNVNILPVFDGHRAVGVIRAIELLDYIGELL